ncbi:MAG: hypothetical protein AUH29_16295 [Candidatus Rokubacteria bacterium 13_1_40CM_69_27]|nr:MAG: hypothetical protein AUH29_16295 [Candidatus Rokubacteria bacterium 13_1_40CM_69_27]OLC37030.1 MAG: hypothetical protein AUH81_07165 [Candidatus Rokubacteria bacterium 13_1_40CM_4_69_5]
MKRMLALVGFGALLTFTLSLVNVPEASADLKRAETAICDAYTNTIVADSFSSFGTPSEGVSLAGSFCNEAMVTMDRAGWHVIHDMRTGGAWFDLSPLLGRSSVCDGDACYELIFLKD